MSAHDLAKKAIEGCFIVFIILGMYYSAITWHWTIPVLFLAKLTFWCWTEARRKRLESELDELEDPDCT